MPLRHVVLWAFRDEVSAAEREALVADLRGLVAAVPALRVVEVGPNISPARAQGYTHLMVQTFDDRAGLAEYAAHPAHQPVAARLRAAAAQLCAVDLEV
ncbi:MAG: hypothetical protein NVS9B6_18700 [Candidatus Limnocylindrales bacterium]